MRKKAYRFSKHYALESGVHTELAIDCIHHGQRELELEPNKFRSRKNYRKGELIVIFKEFEEHYLIITAFWNVRGDKYGFFRQTLWHM